MATTADAAIVARLVQALLAELSGDEAPALATVTEQARAVLAGPAAWAFLAERDGQAVGAMTLHECAAIYAGGTFGEISELYIRPDLRSQGIARLLLDRARTFGLTRGWRRIEVGAPPQPDWQRTVNFYRRNGFAEVGPRLRRLL